MMKGKLLSVVNSLLFLSMLIQIVSGLGQRYTGQDVFIFLRRSHVVNSRVLILLFIAHLYLNWAWIKGWIKTTSLRPRPKKQ